MEASLHLSVRKRGRFRHCMVSTDSYKVTDRAK